MTSSLGLAYTLIAIGVLLLIAEVFVGSGGILFGLLRRSSLACYDVFRQQRPTIGLATLYWRLSAPVGNGFGQAPRTPWGRRMLLQAAR